MERLYGILTCIILKRINSISYVKNKIKINDLSEQQVYA